MIEFQSGHPVRGATLRGSVSSPARSGFQSTHPVRGATMDKAAAAGNNEFQSTRPVWGATKDCGILWVERRISIHAPRVGRDRAAHDRSGAVVISIHAPRVGRDGGKGHAGRGHQHFNPRAPCGARRNIKKKPPSRIKISIHAPRVGRDDKWGQLVYDKQDFNPRAPCGARQ